MNIQCKNCFEEYESVHNICPHCGFEPGEQFGEVFYLYPGTLLNNRYAVGKVLGFGGFGITYKAWDNKLQTIVAIKEYYPSGIVNRAPGSRNVVLFAGNRVKEFEHGLTRFIDEAKTLAKFSGQKNIVHVFEYFQENNSAYIVMEYMDGITLSDFVKTNPVDPETGVDIILSVAAALKDIHAAGIIHRDVSPDNIMVCLNGNIKLFDLGAARLGSADEDKQLTIILKPGFAPPEQYEKINTQGPWTDIYALGATLYYTITGVKPEESTNRRVEDNVEEPMNINQDITQELNNAIMKAMAIDKHMRFQKIIELEAGLKGTKKILPLAVEKKRRKRFRLVSVVAACLVVMMGAGGFLMSYNKTLADWAFDADEAYAIEWLFVMTEDGGAEKETAINITIQGFLEKYEVSEDTVRVSIRGISPEDYEQEVRQAVEEGTTAILFESTAIDTDWLLSAGNVNDISKSVRRQVKKECPFIKHNADKFRLPLGYQVTAIYANESLVRIVGDAATDVGVNGSDRETFLVGEGAMYESDTGDFFVVQAALGGRYKLLRVDRSSVPAWYSYYISAANCVDANAEKLARILINYLYTERAQVHLLITGRTDSLPLNNKAREELIDIYYDFEPFFENMKNYSFE